MAWHWQPPATMSGWVALIVLAVAVMAGILGVFASTGRIGPFRTALFMNLEPLLATIGSALFLGEFITPLQALGGAVMLRGAGRVPAAQIAQGTGSPAPCGADRLALRAGVALRPRSARARPA